MAKIYQSGMPISATLNADDSYSYNTKSDPSEAHIGEVGSNIAKSLTVFGPTVSTTYAAGQILLAPTEITNAGRVAGGTGLVTSIGLALAVANSVQVDAVFFSALPAGAYVAGAALGTPPAADLARISKVMHITDWTSLGGASWGQAPAEPRFYKCDDPTKTGSLWVMLVARGSITLATAIDAALSIRMARN